jgi:hypothetical protein
VATLVRIRLRFSSLPCGVFSSIAGAALGAALAGASAPFTCGNGREFCCAFASAIIAIPGFFGGGGRNVGVVGVVGDVAGGVGDEPGDVADAGLGNVDMDVSIIVLGGTIGFFAVLGNGGCLAGDDDEPFDVGKTATGVGVGTFESVGGDEAAVGEAFGSSSFFAATPILAGGGARFTGGTACPADKGVGPPKDAASSALAAAKSAFDDGFNVCDDAEPFGNNADVDCDVVNGAGAVFDGGGGRLPGIRTGPPTGVGVGVGGDVGDVAGGDGDVLSFVSPSPPVGALNIVAFRRPGATYYITIIHTV